MYFALMFLVLLLLLPLQAPAADGTEEFSGRRDFRGLVRRDMAFAAAELAAEIAAYEQAVRILAKEPDLRFAMTAPPGKNALKENPAAPASGKTPLAGVASMLYAVKPVSRETEGFPPNMTALVRSRLISPGNTRKALQETLAEPELVYLRNSLLLSKRNLLERYDQLASGLLNALGTDGGGKADQIKLQAVCNEMAGLALYAESLEDYELYRKEPQEVFLKLERAERLAPHNPFVLTGLSEVLLQLDRPLQALERITEALKSAPGIARAHAVHGAILLRQRLPVLAADAFDRAIELAPNVSAYYMNRASAFLILEQEDPMCRDFKTACGLGDCEGLKWALEAGKCGKTK